jgi:hypothetical protein
VTTSGLYPCLHKLTHLSSSEAADLGAPVRIAPHEAIGGDGTGLIVLTLAGDQICAMTRFDNAVLQRFGLPCSLPHH